MACTIMLCSVVSKLTNLTDAVDLKWASIKLLSNSKVNKKLYYFSNQSNNFSLCLSLYFSNQTNSFLQSNYVCGFAELALFISVYHANCLKAKSTRLLTKLDTAIFTT